MESDEDTAVTRDELNENPDDDEDENEDDDDDDADSNDDKPKPSKLKKKDLPRVGLTVENFYNPEEAKKFAAEIMSK